MTTMTPEIRADLESRKQTYQNSHAQLVSQREQINKDLLRLDGAIGSIDEILKSETKQLDNPKTA